MTEKEKMLAGQLYRPNDDELQRDLLATRQWLSRFNAASSEPASKITALLLERLGSVGTGSLIRPPFHCDYGYNVHLGAMCFSTSTA